MYNVERFIEAQNFAYDKALEEIRNGHKETHWIWYIFPQLKGIGYSVNAQHYGITCLEEAREYMEHPVLSKRLIEISEALYELDAEDIVKVLGEIDSKKVHACMTLFSRVSDNPIFNKVINRYYAGNQNEITEDMLKRM